MQFYLPCPGLKQSKHEEQIMELLFVDYEYMSVREQNKIDKAIEYGDLYIGQYTVLENGVQVFSTDLGSPEENSRVEIRVPSYVDKVKAVQLLSKLVEEIME